MSDHNPSSHVTGLLLGLAAGDRIGGPIQMATHLAESLYDNNGFKLSDIGTRYLIWWKEDGYYTGPTAARVFSLVNHGEPYDSAADMLHKESGGQTAGCNPVHRNAPLAMCINITDEQLSDYAYTESALTHKHQLAGEASAASNLICRQLILGKDWDTAFQSVYSNFSDELLRVIDKAEKGIIDPDGYAPRVFASAIYFLENNANFDDALNHSIDFAGPANYCPVLVGSFAGSRWGAQNISNAWLEYLKNKDRILSIASILSNQWTNE